MYIRSVALGALFSLPGFVSAAPDCRGQSSGHANERACWIKAAEKSNALVLIAQESLRTRIKNWAEEADPVKATLVLFDESTRQFSHYRQSQCEFAASTAFGGNSAGDMRLICQIALDENYLRSLQEHTTKFSGR